MKVVYCPHCGEKIEISVGRLMGSATSTRKAASSAANGRKGGRPRKDAEKPRYD